MTISDLINYLTDFPDDTLVFLSEDDVSEPCEFIVLDILDYSTGDDDA